MQCIVSQPLPFLVLQNAYLVAKIQIYIGLEQTIILKNIIPQLLFSIILIAPLHVSQSMSCRQWAMWTWFTKSESRQDTQAHIALLWLATNCLRILDNVFDTVTKCLLLPFKSVEQSKLRHACLSKKKTFVEQTNHSPNDYEKVAPDSIV